MAADQDWHSLDMARIFDRLETSARGLSSSEARARREKFGPNSVTPSRKRFWYERLFAQFHNVLIYVLLASATVTAWLGQWIDSSVILGVVVINAIVGFVQEGRAEHALEAIQKLLLIKATAIRSGKLVILPAEDLVPGDVVVIQPGDKVPADLRLFHFRNLQIQEAILTGESLPAEKSDECVLPETFLGDRSNMAFQGTIVSHGRGRGIVVETGDSTQLGRVRQMLASVEPLSTPLLLQLAEFSKWLTAIILVVSAAVFLFGILVHGFNATDMFMAVVGIAVAAIPEGLPAIITIMLALGVERMVARRTIVRRLPAIEVLGSVSVICSDKTGTFTHNEMTVQSAATSQGVFSITGSGYEPRGDICQDGSSIEVEKHPEFQSLVLAGLLCSNAVLKSEKEGWVVDGDPMEGALIVLAQKTGLDPEDERLRTPRLDEIPFEAEYRFMATLHHDHQGHGVIYIKGAPEVILSACTSQLHGGKRVALQHDYWRGHIADFARRGERVLAIAMLPATLEKTCLTFDDVASCMTMLGVFGLQDPPRAEATKAVKTCQSAGIRVKMITGDHAETARAVAAKLGLDNAHDVLTGADLDELSENEFTKQANSVDVFARTSPEHKLRLVQALQNSGGVVAMTGDGVNDAPALKRADIGIAMGKAGSDASKEAAEMILIDDNFASIAAAVEEGRTVYDNLRKAILYILPTSAGEAFTLVAAVLFGLALPITPVQILWVNMVTTVTLSLALAFEKTEEEVMTRRPRALDEPLLSSFLMWRTAYISFFVVCGVFGLFYWLQNSGEDVAYARTASVNLLVMFEVWYLFNVRRLSSAALDDMFTAQAIPAWIFVGIVFVLQLLFIYLPLLGGLFETQPLKFHHLLLTMILPAVIFGIVEIEKSFKQGTTLLLLRMG